MEVTRQCNSEIIFVFKKITSLKGIKKKQTGTIKYCTNIYDVISTFVNNFYK